MSTEVDFLTSAEVGISYTADFHGIPWDSVCKAEFRKKIHWIPEAILMLHDDIHKQELVDIQIVLFLHITVTWTCTCTCMDMHMNMAIEMETDMAADMDMDIDTIVLPPFTRV